MNDVSVRPAGASDAPVLVRMLALASHWRPGAPVPAARDVLADPALAHYVVGWPRVGDAGVVAEAAGAPVGAAWYRFLPADDAGYGHVADDVPEVSIAVEERWRGRGVGRTLLTTLAGTARAGGVAALSLSVEHDNPARHLYASVGFEVVARGEGAQTMVLRTPAP